MGYAIEDIEGIGETYGAKLKSADISSVEKLLELCAAKSGRKEVAEKTGIDESRILKFVNHADLIRIKGIGPQFAELLEAAGVDTVKELRNRNAENLAAKLEEVNSQKMLTKGNFSTEQVQEWIDLAKQTEPAVTY